MKKRILFLVAWSVLLAGCSAPGMKELKAYCEKDAEDWASEKVYVDGYFLTSKEYVDGRFSNYNSDPDISEIILDGYEFLEVYKSNYKIYDDIKETGYIKVYKAERGSEFCNSIYDKEIVQFSEVFFKDYCIASKVVEYPESRYWISYKSEEYQLENRDKSRVHRNETEVIDTLSGKAIAKRITYGLAPWPESALSYGIKYRCKDIGFKRSWVGIPNVINSNKGNHDE